MSATAATHRRAALLAALLVGGLAAPAAPGGQLGEGGYPGPTCGGRPAPPVRPAAFKDNDEIRAYNDQVATYNAAIKTFMDCIQAYVDGASEDIQAIREKVKSVVEESNRGG